MTLGRPSPSASRNIGPTQTQSFGNGRRETHDASSFYDRFVKVEPADNGAAQRPTFLDQIVCGDARNMSDVASNSVALVVTSPPYFAGKQYEEESKPEALPLGYVEHLQMCETVFRECARVLEPGGRIAVNVANLGRKPYRSLSSDIIAILQDRLGLLLRGEIIWKKGDGATSSCAWGSYRKATNPVLRDTTERIIIATKGSFVRLGNVSERQRAGLPSKSTIAADEFMEATLDLWEFPPESAKRIGHAAPFPIELPQRLIELYTFAGDLILDPFCGAGTTAIASLRTARHFIGYDIDAMSVSLAQTRVAKERAAIAEQSNDVDVKPTLSPAATTFTKSGKPKPKRTKHDVNTVTQKLIASGEQASVVAEALLHDIGYGNIQLDVTVEPGVEVSFRAQNPSGKTILVELAGSFSLTRDGLSKVEAMWRTIAKASMITQHDSTQIVIAFTTDVPRKQSKQFDSLASVCGPSRPLTGVIDITSHTAAQQLNQLLND